MPQPQGSHPRIVVGGQVVFGHPLLLLHRGELVPRASGVAQQPRPLRWCAQIMVPTGTGAANDPSGHNHRRHSSSTAALGIPPGAETRQGRSRQRSELDRRTQALGVGPVPTGATGPIRIDCRALVTESGLGPIPLCGSSGNRTLAGDRGVT